MFLSADRKREGGFGTVETKNSPATGDEWTTETWIYLGNSKTVDKKIAVRFKALDESGRPAGDEMFFSPGKRQAFAVGGLYRVECLRQGEGVTARIGGAFFKGLYNDPEYREELEIKQRIFREELRNEQLEKKHRNGFDLPEEWTKLVGLYKKLTGTQKLVFEDLVINKLRQCARR